MFPAERGEMGEEAVRNVFDLAQGGDGALKIADQHNVENL